jgi:hypothetical protein
VDGPRIWGVVCAFIFFPFAREFNWPTPEMTGRGDPKNVVSGVVVATASVARGDTIILTRTDSNDNAIAVQIRNE